MPVTVGYRPYVRGRRPAPVRSVAAAVGPVYDPDATALFARMSPAPDTTRKGNINTLILALKAAGTWTLTDVLYVLAADAEANGLLEWKGNTAYNGVKNGSPAFTIDRGFVGTVAGDYIETSYNPGTVSLGMALNDAHIGVYCTTFVASLNSDMGHNSTSNRVTAGGTGANGAVAAIAALNSSAAGAGTAPLGTVPQYIVGSRTGSTVFTAYRNGVAGTPSATASTALPSTSLTLIGRGSATGGSGRTCAIHHEGRGWTTQQTLDSYTAFAAFLTAIGSPA